MEPTITKSCLDDPNSTTTLPVSARRFPAKHLEIIELLDHGEKTVETSAGRARIDMRLASAHLRAQGEVRLVETRREGKFVHYRPSDPDVTQQWVNVRDVAAEHLVELRVVLDQITAARDALSAQAEFALRIADYDNLRILQGGYAEWKAKGELDAAAKATGQAKH